MSRFVLYRNKRPKNQERNIQLIPKLKIKIYNMCSPNSGREVPNQFIIETPDGRYFKSYDTIIAFIPWGGGKLVLDPHWDYSPTTAKYRREFLNEGIAETRRYIEGGSYIVRNLN